MGIFALPREFWMVRGHGTPNQAGSSGRAPEMEEIY